MRLSQSFMLSLNTSAVIYRALISLFLGVLKVVCCSYLATTESPLWKQYLVPVAGIFWVNATLQDWVLPTQRNVLPTMSTTTPATLQGQPKIDRTNTTANTANDEHFKTTVSRAINTGETTPTLSMTTDRNVNSEYHTPLSSIGPSSVKSSDDFTTQSTTVTGSTQLTLTTRAYSARSPAISSTTANTTQTSSNGEISTGDWGNSTKTGASNTGESSVKSSDNGCLSTIGIVSAISAAVVVFVILTSIICMLKIRRKWRHKLREERVKTDIWTMSTFNNTIINENFADYTLAPTPMPPMRKDGAKWKKNSQKTPRSSVGSQDLIRSWYSDGSRSSTLRRNTFSEPNNIGNKFKTRARRQASEFSDDGLFYDGPTERGRTSTFSVGWNVKSRDRSMLMNHQESIDMSTDDFGVLQLDLVPRNDHIVTEL